MTIFYGDPSIPRTDAYANTITTTTTAIIIVISLFIIIVILLVWAYMLNNGQAQCTRVSGRVVI